ncbi:pyridoxamine 5'-phosphate oxidase family protein [Winogradskyella pulchriflava]|uniref:Pyridoxamine 5'-phosphate oxidase family protein n=1 Tax=Winogradskyella pulchriflava TaxID=1110688 RepID=A0ABV6Q9X4_9FLAO
MISKLKQEACKRLLQQNYIGHLGYTYLNQPFVIPITYFYEGDKIICYSGEGHKIDALRKHNAVALEVSEITSVNQWKSVLVHGTYQELRGSNAKAMLHTFSLGVKDVIMRSELRDLNFISEFSAKISNENIPIVFVINIDDITGRIRNN